MMYEVRGWQQMCRAQQTGGCVAFRPLRSDASGGRNVTVERGRERTAARRLCRAQQTGVCVAFRPLRRDASGGRNVTLERGRNAQRRGDVELEASDMKW